MNPILFQSPSLENLSSRGGNHFGNSRPQSSQGITSARDILESSTPLPIPRDDLSAHDQYLLHQQRQRLLDSSLDERSSFTPQQKIDSVTDGQTSLTPRPETDRASDGQALYTPSHLPKPLVSNSRWKKIQNRDRNFDSNSNDNEHFSSAAGQLGTLSISSPRSILNGGLASPRSLKMSQYPGLDSSFNSISSAYARRKKELQAKMW